MNIFVNNSGHDVVIKPSEYGKGKPSINIIVPNGETYYGSIDSFLDNNRGWTHCCPTNFGIAITGCYVMVFFVFPDKKVRLNPAVQTN